MSGNKRWFRTMLFSLLLVVLVLSTSSCVTGKAKAAANAMEEMGIVGWNYESPLAPADRAQAPVTIRVTDLESEPRREGDVAGLFLQFIPTASALSPYIGMVNQRPIGVKLIPPVKELGQWEIEEILVDELNGNGFTAFCDDDSRPADLRLVGQADFSTKSRAHYLGLGVFTYAIAIVTWPFPMMHFRQVGTAHLELQSDDGERTLMAKDYISVRQYHVSEIQGLFNYEKNPDIPLGKYILPEMVEDFILDMSEIPAAELRGQL